MEFSEVVRKRRMVRSYDSEPIDRNALERIVSAGLRGPSAGFSQGQYLVVVTREETRRAIAELAGEPDYVAQGLPAWISTAPAHIVVCTSEADYHARYQEPDKLKDDGVEIDWPIPYWHTDAGAAMMLVLLAAVDEDLGAGFFGTHTLQGLHDLLGIPEEVTPVGVVTIGRPSGKQPAGSAARGHRPHDQTVHWETW
ncbi:MAG: nitroreductase family protein [Actinomycetota bacterium]